MENNTPLYVIGFFCVLALWLGVFFFRHGRNSAFIDYIEVQYGKRKAWTYIVLVIVILFAIRFVLRNVWVDNPYFEGNGP